MEFFTTVLATLDEQMRVKLDPPSASESSWNRKRAKLVFKTTHDSVIAQDLCLPHPTMPCQTYPRDISNGITHLGSNSGLCRVSSQCLA